MPEPVATPTGETASTPAPAAAAAAAPVAAAAAPAPAAAAPVAAATDEGTLLGDAGIEKAAAPAVKEPTPEEKASAETKLAEDKKLLEADDKTLTPEKLEEKKALLKAQEAAKANVVPEKYIAKLPEGMKMNESLLETITPVLKELNVTQAGFQKLMDAYAPAMQKSVQEAVKLQSDNNDKIFNDMKTEWKAQTTKELGSEPAKEMAFAAKVLNKFGDKEVRQMLNDTGVGNHPALVRLLVKAGKAISEDAMPKGTSTVQKAEGGKLDPAKFYTHPTSPKA